MHNNGANGGRRNGGTDISKYINTWQAQKGHGRAEKIADFLLGYAKIAPYTFISRQLLAKIVNHLTKTPGLDSLDVKTISNNIGRARKILQTGHAKTLYADPHGAGVRCTVDDDDKVATQVDRAAKRVVSAHKNLETEASLVNLSKLRDEAHKRFMTGTVATARKALSQGQMDQLAGLLTAKKDAPAK